MDQRSREPLARCPACGGAIDASCTECTRCGAANAQGFEPRLVEIELSSDDLALDIDQDAYAHAHGQRLTGDQAPAAAAGLPEIAFSDLASLDPSAELDPSTQTTDPSLAAAPLPGAPSTPPPAAATPVARTPLPWPVPHGAKAAAGPPAPRGAAAKTIPATPTPRPQPAAAASQIPTSREAAGTAANQPDGRSMQSADSLHPRALLAQDPARARRLLLEAFGVALRLSLVLMVGWHLNENAQAGRNVVRLWLLPLVDGYPLAGYAPGPLVWWLQPWVEGAALLWVATWYLGLLRRERFKYSFVSTFPRLLLPGYNLVASWPWLDAFAVALERAGGRRRGSRALALVAKAMVVVTALDLIGTLGSYLVRPDLPGWLRVLSTPAGDLALGLQLLFVFGVALLLPRPIRAAPSVEAAAGGAPGAEREDPLSAAVARGQSLPCPRCSPVSALHAPGFAVGPGGSGERVCPTCSGAAIPSAAYEVMLARLHLGPKQLKARQPLPSLPCPCCGQAMASVTIRHGDVYRCRGCGLAWVDGTLIAERRIQPALWAPANGGAGAAPAAGVGDRVAALVLLAVFGAAAVLVAVQQIQTCPALTRADARPLDDGTRVELICVRNKDKAAEGDRWVLDHSGHRVSRTEWGLGYKHGRHEEWTDHGRRLSRRGQYAKGLEDGLWSSWDDEGRLVREERFKAGKPDGRYVEYAHDGTIKLQGNYLAGKKDGLWKTLGDDGKVTLALFDAGADVQLVGSDSEGGTDGGSGDRATAPNPARPSPLKEDLQTGRFGGRQLSWWESRLRELAGRTDAKSARLGELMRHRLSTMGLTVEQGAEAGALKIVAVTAAPAAPSNAAAAAPAARPPPDVGAPPPGSTEVAP